MIRQDLHQLEAAELAYARALELKPDWAEAAVNLGIVQQDQRDMDAALRSYARAAHLRPETLGTIAQALTMGSTGALSLSTDGLRRRLAAVLPDG